MAADGEGNVGEDGVPQASPMPLEIIELDSDALRAELLAIRDLLAP